MINNSSVDGGLITQQRPLFSTARLPLDNFLSGGLIGAMGGFAFNYKEYEEKKIDAKELSKRTLKVTLDGAIVTGFGIYVSNMLVEGKFLNATLGAASGVALMILNEKLITTKD